jgi:hypothetical protein
LRSAAITCGVISVMLLSVGILPVAATEDWRLEFHWSAPPTPPPKGTWAGQTNYLGYRFNRYTDGSGYCWIPLWVFALAPVSVAILLLRRGERIIYILALVPLILALLFVRSLKQDDFVGINHQNGIWSVRAHRGQVSLLSVRWPSGSFYERGLSVIDALERFSVEVRPRALNLLGFGIASTTSADASVDGVAIPYWPLIVASLAPPVLLVRRAVRARRRTRMNQCITCGYDLRETPERCPECGASGARLRRQVAASSAT